jgi:predicted Zn-dependent peptidase
LDLAKNKICAGMILASERPSNRLFSVGNAWTIRRKYEGVRDAAEHYRQVSLDQVQQAFIKLKDRQRVLISVGPE